MDNNETVVVNDETVIGNLLTVANDVIFIIGSVTKGVYSEADPSRELYKIVKDGQNYYAVTEGFFPYLVDSIPEEVVSDKWCYNTEKGFYLNPNWNEMNKYPREYIEGYEQALLDLAAE